MHDGHEAPEHKQLTLSQISILIGMILCGFCLGEEIDAMTRNIFFSLEWKNDKTYIETESHKCLSEHRRMFMTRTTTTKKQWVRKEAFLRVNNETRDFSQVCETEIKFFVLNMKLHCNCASKSNTSVQHTAADLQHQPTN